MTAEAEMHVDCDTCSARGVACSDCVVTFLLGAPPEGLTLDDEHTQALAVLARSGLVPPLRLVRSVDHGHHRAGDHGQSPGRGGARPHREAG